MKNTFLRIIPCLIATLLYSTVTVGFCLGQKTSLSTSNRPSFLVGDFWKNDQRDSSVSSRDSVSSPLSLRQTASSSMSQWPKNSIQSFQKFADKNFFLVGMFVSITLARAFPALGNNGGILKPELFIGKYGVTFIFLLSGLSLDISQITEAASNNKLNVLVQLSTFAVWPCFGVLLRAFFSNVLPSVFPSALLDGLLILTCLPTTVNMCVILASSAGGNTAAALWNAIISNLGGIFFTPALLFRFFGASIQLPFYDMFQKLCQKVLVPVAIGQVLRFTPVKKLYQSNSKLFKRGQELILLSILWNAFCTAISNSLGLELRHGITLLLLLPLMHLVSLGAFFQLFSLLRFPRGDVIAGMFCASQKTLAFGLPLVNTIFEGNPNVATYCAPLMLIHPIQLMIGSALIPKLEEYSKKEDKKS